MTGGRRWQMFAARGSHPDPDRQFHRFGDERTVRFCGLDPVPVELTEDPQGPYWGWIYAPPDRPGQPAYTGRPIMIQGHEGVFRLQSPDGFVEQVRCGDGVVVRMTCREIEQD